ncbi:MAG: Zn-ribbon domain-containing OB-fold protein [Dehalococcoidia bacterium]
MTTETAPYLPSGLPMPAPAVDGLDREYWEATRRHELVVQRCNACKGFQWGPEWICYQCHSLDRGWQQVSGKGVVYSYERIWHPVHPALKDACPYLVVLVELPEAGNVRMVGNLLGDPMQDVPIGAPVEAVFEDHDAENVTLVQWRLA